jgi:hypothetical protein
MKNYNLPIALSILLAFNLCQVSLAQTDNPSSKDTKIEDVGKQLPSAISIGVVDGIIRYVNNERRMKVAIQWEPLPPTDSLLEQSTTQDFSAGKIIKLRINSSDFESGKWTEKIRSNDQSTVLKAFNVNGFDQLTKSLNEIKPDLTPLKVSGLEVSKYMSMVRERNIIRSLIASKGIEYSFGLKPRKNTILSPDYFDKNVTWHIDIYPFQSNQAEYYRFTAKAVIEPLDVKVTNEVLDMSAVNNKKTFYDVRFKLKKNIFGQSNNKFTLDSKEVEVAVPDSVNEGNAGRNALSSDLKALLLPLNGFLSIIGGVEKLGETVEGLLGGTENTSIVAGGLVGFKEGGVSPFIGVNQEIGKIGDDVSGGILLGIGTGNRTSLFIGPSIQSSVFTISAGATVGTQVNSEINFAGMIAVDLSRLTNSKKTPSPTPINVSEQGGFFGASTDAIINKYTFLEYTAPLKIELHRICDENNKKIPDGDKKSGVTIPLELPKAGSNKMIYIPRGVYEYLGTNGKSSYLSMPDDKLYKEVSFPGGSNIKPTCT